MRRNHKRSPDNKCLDALIVFPPMNVPARWLLLYSLCSILYTVTNQAVMAFTADRNTVCGRSVQQQTKLARPHQRNAGPSGSFLVSTFFMASAQGNGDLSQDDHHKAGPARKNNKPKRRKWSSSNKGTANHNQTLSADDSRNLDSSPSMKSARKLPTMEKDTKQRKQQTTTIPSGQQKEMKSISKSTNKHSTTSDLSQVSLLQKRITQLEAIVASQSVELCRLREQWKELHEVASTFTQVVDLLRQAGLSPALNTTPPTNNPNAMSSKQNNKESSSAENTSTSDSTVKDTKLTETQDNKIQDDWEIFGRAPSSVMDAADAAGASILAALLAGKHRMLVDVRDAELSKDPDTLVQFIELAILPVAAGLEGLSSTRNRVKLVFPTVSQLLQYRKSMALAAPDVVALSTLGFDPVEKRDNLVVIIAPPPDDEEGLTKMNTLLEEIRPPVVVLNHHMVPMVGPVSQFEQVYLLRLFTVQYMMGGNPPVDDVSLGDQTRKVEKKMKLNTRDDKQGKNKEDEDNAALEAAMEHAHELGTHQGMTRAMIIRAYPKPWHIFVDTSPDTDADFEVAATFDECPSQDDINYAIVECLEGSEREDELVAQQMQQALEAGQLNKVSEMFGDANASIFGIDQLLDSSDNISSKDDGLFYDDWDLWKDTDTV